jgi:hypothetical protein
MSESEVTPMSNVILPDDMIRKILQLRRDLCFQERMKTLKTYIKHELYELYPYHEYNEEDCSVNIGSYILARLDGMPLLY